MQYKIIGVLNLKLWLKISILGRFKILQHFFGET